MEDVAGALPVRRREVGPAWVRACLLTWRGLDVSVPGKGKAMQRWPYSDLTAHLEA